MKILDKYILKKFLSAFFFVVLILVTIIVVIDLTEKNDDFIKHDLGFTEIMGYFLAFIPYIANFITPITVFIATVFVCSKMAGQTEIVAILSSGVSFRRMMVPFMMGAAIISILSFYLTGYVLPNANKKRVEFEIKYVKKPFRFTDRHVHIKVGPKSYAYMESYSVEANVGYQFSLETIEENKLLSKITARRIEWDTTSDHWLLRDWEKRDLMEMKEIISRGSVKDTLINLTPKDFGNTYHLQETFTIPELETYIAELQERGADNIRVYEIEKFIRYMSPFAAIILTFIGIIMSSRKKRGGSGLMIATGFGLAFVYILFFVFTKSIAEANRSLSTPMVILAVWSPNILFILIGLFLYRTVPK